MKIETRMIQSNGKGSKKIAVASFGLLEAEGKTKTEAKENLLFLMDRHSKFRPVVEVYTHKKHVLILRSICCRYMSLDTSRWKVSDHWAYDIICAGDDLEGYHLVGNEFDNIDDVLLHFAQFTYEGEFKYCPSFVPVTKHSELASWVRFQRIYSTLQSQYKASDHEAHDIAGGNPALPYDVRKVQEMVLGAAVVLTPEQLSDMEKHCPVARYLTTALNRKQVGTKDVYVGWLLGNKPTDFKYVDDERTKAVASPCPAES